MSYQSFQLLTNTLLLLFIINVILSSVQRLTVGVKDDLRPMRWLDVDQQ